MFNRTYWVTSIGVLKKRMMLQLTCDSSTALWTLLQGGSCRRWTNLWLDSTPYHLLLSFDWAWDTRRFCAARHKRPGIHRSRSWVPPAPCSPPDAIPHQPIISEKSSYITNSPVSQSIICRKLLSTIIYIHKMYSKYFQRVGKDRKK